MNFFISILFIIFMYLMIKWAIDKSKKTALNSGTNDPIFQKAFNIKSDNDLQKEEAAFFASKPLQKSSPATNKAKGEAYEKYLVSHFKKLGYTVAPHGLDNGNNDRGIDIILKKGSEVLFIQAKNWQKNTKYDIGHKDIKAFVGDVAFYLEDNPMFAMGSVKRYYITSHDILNASAKKFIAQHHKKIESIVMPMPSA